MVTLIKKTEKIRITAENAFVEGDPESGFSLKVRNNHMPNIHAKKVQNKPSTKLWKAVLEKNKVLFGKFLNSRQVYTIGKRNKSYFWATEFPLKFGSKHRKIRWTGLNSASGKYLFPCTKEGELVNAE